MSSCCFCYMCKFNGRKEREREKSVCGPARNWSNKNGKGFLSFPSAAIASLQCRIDRSVYTYLVVLDSRSTFFRTLFLVIIKHRLALLKMIKKTINIICIHLQKRNLFCKIVGRVPDPSRSNIVVKRKEEAIKRVKKITRFLAA